MLGPELHQDNIDQVAKDKLVDKQEAKILADELKNNTQEMRDLFSLNASQLVSWIEKGLNNKQDLTQEDIKNYTEVCKFIDDNSWSRVDNKLETVYTMLGYKEFKNIYHNIDNRNLLNLSDEQLQNYYTEYSNKLVAQGKSFYVLLNTSDYDKQNTCVELFKGAYIDHVVEKITKFNFIDGNWKKLWLKNEQITGVWTSHNYSDEVINDFKESLELSATEMESVYNLAGYINDLESENKNEALWKLSLFLLKPINDMVKENWQPKKFVFAVGWEPSAAARNSDFMENEQDLVHYKWWDKVSNIKANKGDKSDLVEFNYVLEKDEKDTKFNDNYRMVNQTIENGTKDASYNYTLVIDKEYKNYVNQGYFKDRVDIQFVDESKKFELKKEKEVLSDPMSLQAKVSGLDFNKKPTNEQIFTSLNQSPEFQPLLMNPEQYVINSCAVKWSASHVPTDYTSPYSSYDNISNEKLLSDEWSDTNKVLAKDRAYTYINYINNQWFVKWQILNDLICHIV